MSNYDYKNIASDYDIKIKQYNWIAPDLIYANMLGYVAKDKKLLDVGVGTGISSERFYNNNIELYGLDNSPEMITICKSFTYPFY